MSSSILYRSIAPWLRTSVARSGNVARYKGVPLRTSLPTNNAQIPSEFIHHRNFTATTVTMSDSHFTNNGAFGAVPQKAQEQNLPG